jgi:bifunctional DNA-binding transcriptional regulator/antitoxin component of YhaV-PrlF toxin-antitoxin module
MKGPPFTVPVSSKSQMTVPAWIVRRLGWQPGQRLAVTGLPDSEFKVTKAVEAASG